MHKIMIVGAGKTGRGFIARLAKESNCPVTLVDQNEQLVQALNDAGKFEISYFDRDRENTVVDHFHACTWEKADFSQAEWIFVSVGGQNLEDEGKRLHNALQGEKERYVIACENASNPAKKLSALIANPCVHVSEGTVFCTTIEEDGLNIASENYPYLQCDADLLGGGVPPIAAVKPVGNFGNFLTRKLFTYNAASCVIAYLGAYKGYNDYAKAANDPEILSLLDANYLETNRAMCLEFGYEEADQKEFALLSRIKFTSTAIRDTVERNARDVARKMAAGERIMGILQLIRKHGGKGSVLKLTAAAALLYPWDEKWLALRKEQTDEEILGGLCGVKEAKLRDEILSLRNELMKKERTLKEILEG